MWSRHNTSASFSWADRFILIAQSFVFSNHECQSLCHLLQAYSQIFHHTFNENEKTVFLKALYKSWRFNFIVFEILCFVFFSMTIMYILTFEPVDLRFHQVQLMSYRDRTSVYSLILETGENCDQTCDPWFKPQMT